MKYRMLSSLVALVFLGNASLAAAPDLTGVWTAEFDTQIGLQKYAFTFQQEGDKITGKAKSNIAGETRETDVKDGKRQGDTLTFSEMLDFQGNTLRIDYSGKVAADEIRLTRKVGEFATEQLVARRGKLAAGELARSAAPLLASGDSVETVRLYDGRAPGSENWTQIEKEVPQTVWGGPVVCNVVNPSLTVVRPAAAVANGTAVVICPGGAFFLLSINSEGMDVARWLAQKGVTCFVLRYRLVETKTGDPAQEVMARGDLDPIVKPIVPLALADAQAAISYIRKNATQYGVNPQRIGIMGFSAGGTVASSAGYNYTPETRPDFVAPIYLAYAWTLKGQGVPQDAPPMFILAATDDPLGLASHSVDLYRDWIAAKKPAELHLFARGGHGFGMNKQNLPTDRWIERFADWLEFQGLLPK
ncbi:MAG: alpha/beta hydrolase [Verrucomicrobiota bacterium]